MLAGGVSENSACHKGLILDRGQMKESLQLGIQMVIVFEQLPALFFWSGHLGFEQSPVVERIES